MHKPNEATMFLNLSPPAGHGDSYVKYTVLHEAGHALGLHHEHQHPKFGSNLFKDGVIEAYLRDECQMTPAEADKCYLTNYAPISWPPLSEEFKYNGNSIMRYPYVPIIVINYV